MSSQVQKTRGLDLLLKIENHIKSRIQHYERSELVLHFELPKVHFKNAKNDKSKDTYLTIGIVNYYHLV